MQLSWVLYIYTYIYVVNFIISVCLYFFCRSERIRLSEPTPFSVMEKNNNKMVINKTECVKTRIVKRKKKKSKKKSRR